MLLRIATCRVKRGRQARGARLIAHLKLKQYYAPQLLNPAM
jgi:hypothetical protein